MTVSVRSLSQYFCIFLLGLSFWGISLSDPDLGWHLLGGEYVLGHGWVPHGDFINALRVSWHDYHWLYQVFLVWLYQVAGLYGIALGFGCMSGIFFVALFALIRHELPAALAIIAFLLVYLVLQPSWVLRPQAVSLLVLAGTQTILEKKPRYELPLLFIFAVVLSNMHVYWVFIPTLWFGYRVLPRLLSDGKESERPVYAWGGCFLLAMAALISPYGIFSGEGFSGLLQNYAVLWDYLFLQSSVKDRVAEMNSPFALGGYIGPFLLLTSLLLARWISFKTILTKPGRYFFCALAFLLACMSAKYLGLFALSLVFILPLLTQEFSFKTLSDWSVVRFGSTVLLAATGMYGAWMAFTGFPDAPKLKASLEANFPIKECRFIAQQRAGQQAAVRVLTHFNSGGWCSYAAYETDSQTPVRVLVDNRTQGIPDSFYREAFDLFELSGRWFATLREWKFDYLVISKARPLAQLLSLDRSRWKVVFEGERYVVFIRT